MISYWKMLCMLILTYQSYRKQDRRKSTIKRKYLAAWRALISNTTWMQDPAEVNWIFHNIHNFFWISNKVSPTFPLLPSVQLPPSLTPPSPLPTITQPIHHISQCYSSPFQLTLSICSFSDSLHSLLLSQQHSSNSSSRAAKYSVGSCFT